MSENCDNNCGNCGEDCADRKEEKHDFRETLNELSHVKKVIGIVSGKGGVGKSSVSAMLAIRDTMRAIPNRVRTVNLGLAASAGQFLLSAGEPGHRYSLPHAKVLLHQGSAGFGGTAGDIAIQTDDLRHTRDTVLGLIATDTGQDVATVERDSRRDRWFDAGQAKAYGFLDHIVESIDEIRPRPRAGIGLGVAS